jgi:hypothetical protein
MLHTPNVGCRRLPSSAACWVPTEGAIMQLPSSTQAPEVFTMIVDKNIIPCISSLLGMTDIPTVATPEFAVDRSKNVNVDSTSESYHEKLTCHRPVIAPSTFNNISQKITVSPFYQCQYLYTYNTETFPPNLFTTSILI